MKKTALQVRLKEKLRAQLAKQAKKNGRSLNGEIIYRLAATFGPEGLLLLKGWK